MRASPGVSVVVSPSAITRCFKRPGLIAPARPVGICPGVSAPGVEDKPQAGAGRVYQDAPGRFLLGTLRLDGAVDYILLDEYSPALARLGAQSFGLCHAPSPS